MDKYLPKIRDVFGAWEYDLMRVFTGFSENLWGYNHQQIPTIVSNGFHLGDMVDNLVGIGIDDVSKCMIICRMLLDLYFMVVQWSFILDLLPVDERVSTDTDSGKQWMSHWNDQKMGGFHSGVTPIAGYFREHPNQTWMIWGYIVSGLSQNAMALVAVATWPRSNVASTPRMTGIATCGRGRALLEQRLNQGDHPGVSRKCPVNNTQKNSAWWMVAMNLAFSQKYWVAIIIPIDGLHHFSGRGGPGPPSRKRESSS